MRPKDPVPLTAQTGSAVTQAGSAAASEASCAQQAFPAPHAFPAQPLNAENAHFAPQVLKPTGALYGAIT